MDKIALSLMLSIFLGIMIFGMIGIVSAETNSYCEDYPQISDCVCKNGIKTILPCIPPENGACSAIVSYTCVTNCTIKEDCYPAGFVPSTCGNFYSCIDNKCIVGSNACAIEDNSSCKNLYWIDKDNKDCSQKQFCGAYMYYGLQTFESKTQCEKAVNNTCSITSSSKTQECYANLAITNNDYSICENLASASVPGWIPGCYARIAVEKNNKTICDLISDSTWPGYNNQCYDMVNAGEVEPWKTDSKDTLNEKNLCPISENNLCYKTLSNGRKAEIKIMPETASATAIAKLGELGFTIQLKEVGKGDNAKPVYELTGNKQGKFLGIFKIIASEKVQVDAETGEVIKIKKTWWSFLVKEDK
ncbi:MAG: PepSY domain-containing protein [Nanoarchaeota archaeon]